MRERPRLAALGYGRLATGDWRLVVTLALLLPLAQPAMPVQGQEPLYHVERTFSLPIAGEGNLALAGSLLIWQETTTAGLTRVSGLDLQTNRRLPLPAAAGDQRQPAIAGPLVAWIEDEPVSEQPQLIVYDLDLHRRTVVTGPEARPDRPAIDGTTIVWRDGRGGAWGIYGYDLVDGVEFPIATGPGSHGPPAIDRAFVVWDEYRDGSWDVVGMDLGTRRTVPLATGSGDQVNPRVDAGRVVYEERPPDGGPPSLKQTTTAGGASRTIVGGHLVTEPALAGRLVVWEDWRDGVAGIFAYDLDQQREVPIVRSPQARQPVVDGLTVAWLNVTQFGAVITGANLRPILPSDRRDPPLTPDPNVLYFPETGHALGYGFKSFWQQRGGLPVFGYPLTEEFAEADPATGRARTVQYFERFVLEYDASEPDPARRVTIARLGATWLAGREPRRLPPVADEADRRYFPETGHTLAAGFKRYWDSHDGLRLLGFPLTEELDEGGRTVQYFERGRLELNPDTDDPRFRIAPGALGREVLTARGWLPGGPPGPARRPLPRR